MVQEQDLSLRESFLLDCGVLRRLGWAWPQNEKPGPLIEAPGRASRQREGKL